jgi:hypothetical protein
MPDPSPAPHVKTGTSGVRCHPRQASASPRIHACSLRCPITLPLQSVATQLSLLFSDNVEWWVNVNVNRSLILLLFASTPSRLTLTAVCSSRATIFPRSELRVWQNLEVEVCSSCNADHFASASLHYLSAHASSLQHLAFLMESIDTRELNPLTNFTPSS